MRLRRFTREGVSRFEAFLTNLETDARLQVPEYLLTDPKLSEGIGGEVEIEVRSFETRLEAAKYLDCLICPAGLTQPEGDVGLWSWLALLYFDQLCPLERGGVRKVNEHARYVPQIDMSRRYYRHMLLGPWMMLQAHRDCPDRLLGLLSSPMNVATSETYRLFIENASLISCPAVVEMATWLYFDRQKGKLKRGSGAKVAGGCRRLIQFLQQLDCTFEVLPAEA